MAMKFSSFQLIVTAFFVVCIVGGVAVFAIFGGSKRGEQVGQVTIWGTIDQKVVEAVITELAGTDDAFQSVSYREISALTYERELVEAIASGRAPDVFMLNESQILSFSDKIVPIPYNRVSERVFTESFIDEGNLFLGAEGSFGLPVLIDPLVMYYNKDLFAAAGIPTYPRQWEGLQSVAPKITSLDVASNVKRSAVALGSYDNVRHAKEILTTLFFQAGDKIVGTDVDGNLTSVFGANNDGGVENPAEAALRYYTSFSNPVQTVYSWNRSLPDSFNAFVAGDLGIYFGFASEYKLIRARNPNLAFDAAVMPQTGNSRASITYGRMTALSIPKGAANEYGGMIIAEKLTGIQAAKLFADRMGLPPVRRDLIADTPADAVGEVFAQSALISRSWYDPDPQASAGIYKRMVESVVSGRDRLGDAVRIASGEFSDLFMEFNNR